VGARTPTLEKTNHQEGDREKSDAGTKADDAKDQTCKGDAVTTESAEVGSDPPAGDDTHDRRTRAEYHPGDTEEKDREDERQDAGDEGGISKTVDAPTGTCGTKTPLLTTRSWRRKRARHGSRLQTRHSAAFGQRRARLLSAAAESGLSVSWAGAQEPPSSARTP
jgi:hypothetical protein